MTRNLTGDIPGWGALFHNNVGDGTVTVSAPEKKKTIQLCMHLLISQVTRNSDHDGYVALHNSKPEEQGRETDGLEQV